MNRYALMVPCLAVLCAALPAAHAADISIETAQEIYYYGDRLTYTVTVSEVTGEPAFLYIVDAGGTKSSAIPLPVSQPVTEFASPFPFEAATYQVGGWTLEIYYGESQSEAAFTLMDSGRAVIPTWIKDAGRLWIAGASEEYYLSAIEYLVDQGILQVDAPPAPDDGRASIPEWVKVITAWWIQGHVADHEYASAIEYLINHGAIRVGQQ